MSISEMPSNKPAIEIAIGNIGKKIEACRTRMREIRNKDGINDIWADADEIQKYNAKIRALSIIRADLIYYKNML